MSVQAMSHVIANSKHKGSAFVVLLMIANHAHSDGSGAWAGLDTLADESRISRRQVIRIIPKLSKSGELRVQKGTGPMGTNLYTVTGVNEKSTNPQLSTGVTSCHGDKSLSEGVTFLPVGSDKGVTRTKSNQIHNRTTGADAPLPSHPVENTKQQTRSERDRIDADIEHRRNLAARDRRLDREQEVRREVKVGCVPEPAYAAEARRRIAELAKAKGL